MNSRCSFLLWKFVCWANSSILVLFYIFTCPGLLFFTLNKDLVVSFLRFRLFSCFSCDGAEFVCVSACDLGPLLYTLSIWTLHKYQAYINIFFLMLALWANGMPDGPHRLDSGFRYFSLASLAPFFRLFLQP